MLVSSYATTELYGTSMCKAAVNLYTCMKCQSYNY